MSASGSQDMARHEEQVVQEFQQRRARLNDMFTKINELSSEVAEHSLVIDTLKPMEAGRRCFRMIGEVLVERTVGETLPAVTQHRDKLVEVINTLKAQYKQQEKELQEYQSKYKIRIVAPQELEQEEEEAAEREAAKPSKGQGVLVSSS